VHAIGPIIRLDHEADFRAINLFKDWGVDEQARTVHYWPGSLTFLIDYVSPPEGDWLKPMDLSAQLVHACNGTKVPNTARLRQIAKDAIHAFLLIADVCHKPTNEDEIPF